MIPAAGLGTRFLPATKAVPKEMLPIVDIPTIQLVIDEAVRAGITDVVLINGRNKHAIEDHFDHAFELERTLRDRGNAELADSMLEISTMVLVPKKLAAEIAGELAAAHSAYAPASASQPEKS